MAEHQTVKSLLRKLYHRVHPDRFLGHPRAQEDNLRSFQRLQSLLLRTEGSGGLEERIRFHLAPLEGVASGANDTQEPLQVVECRLRPASLDGDLRHMLRLCGLEPGPSSSRVPSASSASAFRFEAAKAAARRSARRNAESMPSWWALRQPKVLSREASFGAFITKHAADQRVALAESERHSAEVGRLLSELREAFQIQVVLRDRWIPSLCARTLFDLKEQLHASSHAQRGVLKGAEVVVSANADVACAELDGWGALLVPAQLIHRKALLELADRLDVREVEQRRARARHVRELERSAALALGLGEVAALDGRLRAQSAYWSFLQGLAAEARASATSRAHLDAWARAARSDASMAGRMPADSIIDFGGGTQPAANGAGRAPGGAVALPVSLWRAVVEPSAALEETHTLRTHNSRRLVHVPMHASPHAIGQYLGYCGSLAATQMAMQGEALDTARRHIGAKRLSADQSLSDGQVMAACTRLGGLEPRAAARKLCAGLSLHLALSFSAEESGKIKVRWDFED